MGGCQCIRGGFGLYRYVLGLGCSFLRLFLSGQAVCLSSLSRRVLRCIYVTEANSGTFKALWLRCLFSAHHTPQMSFNFRTEINTIQCTKNRSKYIKEKLTFHY